MSLVPLWWIDLASMPGAHKRWSINPLLYWIGERKYSERLMDRDKVRETSFTSYHYGQNRLNPGKLVLLLIRPEQDNKN